jgi:hypothetical protein
MKPLTEIKKEIEDIRNDIYKEYGGVRLRQAVDKTILSCEKLMEQQAQEFEKMIEDLYLKKCKEQGLDKSEWTDGEMFSYNELLKEVQGDELK